MLVLGATGPTGQHVVSQALQQGHLVTVFVRRPERLAHHAGRLRVLTGSLPNDAPALDVAVRGQEAVISTLGVGQSLRSAGLLTRSMPVIIQAMESQGVRRFIFTSAYGVGATRRDVPLVPRILMRVLLRDLYADKAAAEAVLRQSGLDWTLVYPVTLTNGPRMGRYRTGERLALRGLPRIARADVAAFLLSQLDDATFVRKGVLISA